MALADAWGQDARLDYEGILRYAIGVAAGLVATVLLFFLMQALIKSDKIPFSARGQGQIVEFVRLEEEAEEPIHKLICGWPPWLEPERPTETPQIAEIETWLMTGAAGEGPMADEAPAMWPAFPIACPPPLLKPGERARGQTVENAAWVFETGCVAFNSLAQR